MVEATKKNPLGPTGKLVAQRVKELRELHGWSYKDLSDRLADRDRVIPPLGLRRIESFERRIDADDLVALAVVLGVNVSALLLPGRTKGNIEVTAAGSAPAERVWAWADGRKPLPLAEADPDGVALADFYDYGRPGEDVETIRWLLAESREFRRRFVKRLENVPDLGGWTVEYNDTGEVVAIALPAVVAEENPLLWSQDGPNDAG